jgi:small-conductance mechanosensitive channel
LLLEITLKLTLAWIVIALLASVIRNRFAFRVVVMCMWVVVALSVLGWLPAVTALLDNTALTIGAGRISVLRVIKAIGLALVLGWMVKLLAGLADKGLASASDVSPSMKVLLGKIVRILLVVVGFAVAMAMVGIDLTAFAVLSGALGVGLGFGLQKTVSNFISGIWLLLDKSIKPGDVISMGETFGWISQINTRYTSVVTRDGREHLIPNEQLITQEVINWSYTDDKVRLDVPFGVSHKSDPHLVRKVVREAIADLPRVLNKPVPVVNFVNIGDSSLQFVARFWIRDPVAGLMNVKSEVLFAIWDALKANAISIPHPQRDIHFPDGVKIVKDE